MNKKELAIILVIVSLAIVARIVGINWRPPSNDEMGHIFYGIQALHGTYYYNPEWHGPLEHYIIAFCLWFFPFSRNPFLTIAVIRLFYSFFSILAGILGYYLMKDYLRLPGRIVLASLLMFSPESLYYSRFIHESALMAPIMISCAFSFIRYVTTWRKKYLYLSTIFFSLGFITKESWVIYLGMWISFAIILYISAKIRKNEKILGVYRKIFSLKGENLRAYLVCLTIFLFISFLFYSSFGKNPVGFLEGFVGPFHWVGRVHDHILGPLYYWFDRIWLYDLYLIPAVIYAIIREEDDITAFFIYWFIVSFAFYSYIQERLPRLMMNITFPGIVVASKVFDRVYEELRVKRRSWKGILRKAGAISFVILIAISFWESGLANYVNYDTSIEPLVYPKLPHQWYSFYHQVWNEEKEGKPVNIAICWPQGTFGYVNVFLLWFTYADPTPVTSVYSPNDLLGENYTYIILYQGYLQDLPESFLKEYKVLGPYPVLVWTFHEEYTSKTTLSGFIHDFSHYLDPSFYFLRKCPPLPQEAWNAYLLVER